jgi:hypothetical protein
MRRSPQPASGAGPVCSARRTSGRNERASASGELRATRDREQILVGGNRVGTAREHLVHPAGPRELGSRFEASGLRCASAEERKRVALLRVFY